MAARVLLLGGTGHVGAPLAHSLVKHGAQVTVLSRDAKRARAVLPPEAKVVRGDIIHHKDLLQALEGCDRVALALSGGSDLLDLETRSLKAITEVESVSRLVKLSCDSAVEGSGVALGGLHRQSEAQIAASGIPHAILRPRFMFQNLLEPPLSDMISDRSMVTALNKARLQAVDARDVAESMRACLLSPTSPSASSPSPSSLYDLCGPEALSMEEMAQQLSAGLPFTIRFGTVPLWATRLALWTQGVDPFIIAHVLQSAKFYNATTPTAGGDVERLTGQAARSFRQFVEDHVEAWAPSKEKAPLAEQKDDEG